VRNLERPSQSFEFLISDAVCQQDRLRIFDLNQQISHAAPRFRERNDIDPAEQSCCIQTLLSLEHGFGIVRRIWIEPAVPVNDLFLSARIARNENLADLVRLALSDLKCDTHPIVRFDALDCPVHPDIGVASSIVILGDRSARLVDDDGCVDIAFLEGNSPP
jgi:hypothetical protein